MAAEHDDFIGLIRTGNFADDVICGQIVVVELVLSIHLDSNRNILLDHAPDAAIVLDGQNGLKRDRGILRISGASALDEHRASVALPRFEQCSDSFIKKKLQTPAIELGGLTASA